MLRTTLAATAMALVMAAAASAEPCADCDPGGGGGGGGGVTKPTAAFTYDNNKLSQTFVGMTSTSTGTITSYDWDFGDGSGHGTTANTQHQYSKGGVYHVTLTVGNSAGTTSVTHDVTVQNRYPTPGFVASDYDVMTGETVDFKDGGYDADGNLAAWAWSFGDMGNDSFSNVQNPTHSYAKSGTYTVQLQEWDDQGAGVVTTQQVVVHNRAPQGAIVVAPLDPMAGQTVAFGAGASDPDGSVASYAWDFGAAGSSTDAAPHVTFAAAGSYPVKVTITDDEGAQTTLGTTVTVTAVPVTDPPVTTSVITPVTAPPVATPVTTPVVNKPVKKPSCKKKVRYVVKKVHGKRKKVKKLVCVKKKR
jgi:PKD repeat protein